MDIVDRIFDLAARKYPEQKMFAEALGLPPGRISEWKKRKSESYVKRLPQIAQVLGTTPEYLLTGAESTIVPLDDPDVAAFLEEIRPLTSEERAKVIEYINFLKSQRK